MEGKYTQVEFSKGLFELDETTLKELAGSKYMNDDLRPTTKAERTWNTYNISMLWIGMVICITGFSFAAALIALGMSPILALINVAIGNLLVLVPMQLNSNVGTCYGIPFPIFAKLAFGMRGAHIPALLRTIVASGWCSIQCWVGAAAFSAIIGCFVDGWDVNGTGRFIGFGLFLIVTLLLGFKGSEGIKWIENLGSPVLIVMCIALVFWVIALGHDVGMTVGDIFLAPSNTELINENGGMLFVFMAGITSNIAVWATLALNIPDFSRYAKSQKCQFRGQMFAMPVSAVALATIGAMFAQVTYVAYGEAQYDPTAVLLHLNNKFIIIIVSLGTVLGTLTTNMAANVVAPANGFASLAPQKISYRMGLIFTVLLCIAFRPWWIYGSAGAFMFTFLGTCGTILSPVAAVLVADYFIVKKQRVNVKALYDESDGTYQYSNGWNVKALISWIVGAFLPMLGMFGIGGAVTHWMEANSYIIGFLISLILYSLLMKSDKKSFITEEEFNNMTKRYEA